MPRGKKLATVNNVDPKSRDFLLMERIRNAEKRSEIATDPAVKGVAENDLRKAKSELWRCYEKLVFKMRNELIECCRRNKFEVPIEVNKEYDEYVGLAYEKFERTVASIDMAKWEHLKAKAQLYQQFWGYLRSMNRDLIGAWIDNRKNTVQIYDLGDDEGRGGTSNVDVYTSKHYQTNEDRMELEFARKVFNESMAEMESTLHKGQLDLWNAKKAGEPINATCKKFNVKQKDFKSLIESCADRVKTLVPDVSAKFGQRISYKEMVEALSV